MHQQKRHARDQAHRGDALGREIMTDTYIYIWFIYTEIMKSTGFHMVNIPVCIYIYGLEISRDIDI